MKKFYHIYMDFKFFSIISFAIGISIILFSLLGHFTRPGNLIPYSMVGGSIGILIGTYFLYRKSFIKEKNVIGVAICGFIAFGLTSLIAIFNLDKPFLILSSFLLIGFTTLLSNWYFQKYNNISNSLKYGILGIILILPT